MLFTKLSVKLPKNLTVVPITESSVTKSITELFLKLSKITSDVRFLARFSRRGDSEVKFAVTVVFRAMS